MKEKKEGERGSIGVEALCYKPEGRVFGTRWGEFFFLLFFSSVPNPSRPTRPWDLLIL
jgi:hypothetical protein